MAVRAGWFATLILLASCGELETHRQAGPMPAPPAAEAAEVALALDGEGLRMVIVATGSTRPVAFGTTRDTLATMLTRLYPGSPVDTGTNVDCALGYATWPGGLVTTFRQDRFVGWSVRDSGLTTMSGIGVGATGAAVDSAYQVESFASSLGREFTAGGLAGVFSADDRVATLWAGEVCLAR